MSISDQLDAMDDWFKIGMGTLIFEEEQSLFGDVLERYKPHALAQLGGEMYMDFPTKETHSVHVDPRLGHISVGHNVCALLHQLPFRENCFDLVLCPHVHELMVHPVTLFHEIWRVLKPEGKLLIFGFNTFSLWGLQRLMGRGDIAPWNRAFRTTRLIVRAVKRQGFVVDQLTTHCYGLYSTRFTRLSSHRMFNYLGGHLWPYSGAVYALLVTKREEAYTPGRVEIGVYS